MTTCPSCGTSLESDAVLCIQCGFDLRTGQRLPTKVLAGPAADRQDRFAGQRFDVCQLQGVSTKILVCDEDGDVVAYLQSPVYPLWSCFTVLIAVPLLFLVPAGLGFLFYAVAERAKIPAPGTVLTVILVTLAVGAGLLALSCTLSLMTPRRRVKVWEDQSRQQLLMRVVETWKFGEARISVIGADGQPVGRILHHRRGNRYVLVNDLEQPRAVLVSGKIEYANEWAGRSLPLTFLLLGLPGLLGAFLSRRERSYTESFLYRISSFQEPPTEEIGRISFNLVREDPYRIEFSADPENTVDRRLVVALMGLLEW